MSHGGHIVLNKKYFGYNTSTVRWRTSSWQWQWMKINLHATDPSGSPMLRHLTDLLTASMPTFCTCVEAWESNSWSSSPQHNALNDSVTLAGLKIPVFWKNILLHLEETVSVAVIKNGFSLTNFGTALILTKSNNIVTEDPMGLIAVRNSQNCYIGS